MRLFHKLAAVAAITTATLGAVAGAALADSRMFVAHLYGGNEVPVPGDANAYGIATVMLIPGGLCYSILLNDAAPAISAGILVGPAGVVGGVAVVLPVPGGVPTRIGNCVGVAAAVLAAIQANPQNYYVNVRNGPFPGGAARGQLQ